MKRFGLLYRICKMMFVSYKDYLEKMKVYQKVRLVQVESWCVEILALENYSKLNHQNLLVGMFEAGVVDVNKIVKFMRDEGRARLFMSDNPVVTGSYISLFLKANGCLKTIAGGGGWKGERHEEEDDIVISDDESEDEEIYVISDDDSDED